MLREGWRPIGCHVPLTLWMAACTSQSCAHTTASLTQDFFVSCLHVVGHIPLSVCGRKWFIRQIAFVVCGLHA